MRGSGAARRTMVSRARDAAETGAAGSGEGVAKAIRTALWV